VSGGHRAALLDWLACAAGGWAERAPVAARAVGDGLLERTTALGTAGHVLDFDDTWTPGLIHLSAAAAPAALALAAELDRPLAEVAAAHAEGFEAAAALAAAGHPALYDGGWHPTAVCGTIGAAIAAARLLGLDAEREHAATGLAVLRASGMLAAFGSDGKALQVGMAAAAGVHAARLAAAGARGPEPDRAYESALAPARWATPDRDRPPAVDQNWIKAYPCCLQTHAAIEAAAEVGGAAGKLTVAVHPLSRRAAPYDEPADGLQAKFSIPYLAAFALLHGPPGVEDFERVDADVQALAANRIRVRTDAALGQSEARIEGEDGALLARVEAPLGSPGRPMDAAALRSKCRALAGSRLDGALDDPEHPARALLAALAATGTASGPAGPR
jgi:2-methylcitrate dehydratase PrpD